VTTEDIFPDRHQELDSERPAPLDDGEWHQLDPRYLIMSQISIGVWTAVLALAFAIGIVGFSLLFDRWDLLKEPLSLGLAGLIVAQATLGLIRRHLHFRHAAWRLDQSGLELKGGAFWRHRTAVPRSRLQHADVTSGPVERHFGLATLVVHTAGSQAGAISLAGLDASAAVELRDLLLEGDSVAPI
jgi:membrane protein YdbS with pleckstrin-like domain